MNSARFMLLLAASCATACTTPGGSSSTGVGNPGVISLGIVTDDELELTPADNAGAPGSAGGGSEPVDGAGGGSELVGSAGGGSEPVDDDLPRMSVKHAELALGLLRWLPCDAGLDPTIASGPFVIDLVNHTTSPEIPAVAEPAGGFCGLEAPLAVVAAPAELAGRSLFFDGVRADGTLFLLYADVQATLRVRRHAEVVWNSSETPAVLWAFRPRRWLSRAALDAASATPFDDGSNAVVIDANRHPLLLAAIRRRLAGESTLFRDLNENHELDPEDRNVIVGDGSDDAD